MDTSDKGVRVMALPAMPDFVMNVYLSPEVFCISNKKDYLRRFDQLSWKNYINVFRDHGGVFACDMQGLG